MCFNPHRFCIVYSSRVLRLRALCGEPVKLESFSAALPLFQLMCRMTGVFYERRNLGICCLFTYLRMLGKAGLKVIGQIERSNCGVGQVGDREV